MLALNPVAKVAFCFLYGLLVAWNLAYVTAFTHGFAPFAVSVRWAQQCGSCSSKGYYTGRRAVGFCFMATGAPAVPPTRGSSGSSSSIRTNRIRSTSRSTGTLNRSFSSTLLNHVGNTAGESGAGGSGIECEHFSSCPGCVVNADVSNVDVVTSARTFFSSPSIRRNVLQPSLDRTDSQFWKLAGSVDGPQEDDMSMLREQEEEENFSVIVPSALVEWRTQAKLAVSAGSTRGSGGYGCDFGLYNRGTHDVIPIPHCRVHHPSINEAVEALHQATSAVMTIAYDETTGTGMLRYVQMQVERSTRKVCLTLVWNADSKKESQPGLARLVKELKRTRPHLWHSIWCHLNTSTGNNIFARGTDRWFLIDGPEFVREPLPWVAPTALKPIVMCKSGKNSGNTTIAETATMMTSSKKPKHRRDGLLYFTPSTFRQGNMDGFDKIAAKVARAVPPGSAVCELYAGVGLLGLTVLSHAHRINVPRDGQRGLRWLRCSDENSANLRCFEKAVGSMPTEVTGRPSRHGLRITPNGKNRKKSRRKQEPTFEELMNGTTSTKVPEQGKVTYKVASAAKALEAGEGMGADVIIVDPPRSGLDAEVLDQLCRPIEPHQLSVDNLELLFGRSIQVNLLNDATTLIYVSCGFDAFAMDCERLLSRDAGWSLQSATGYILFPGSNHMETVAIFKRMGRMI